MDILTIQEIKQLKSDELKIKILEVQKSLFDLRFKQSTQKTIKTHLIKKYKHLLAQLKTIEHKLK